jgi:hypothetical protein
MNDSRPKPQQTRPEQFKGRAYWFIKFNYFTPTDVSELSEDADTNYGDVPPTEMFKETLYDLIRVAQATGLTDQQIDGVIRKLVDQRADEIRDGFKVL